MRRVLLLGLLVACGDGGPTGPITAHVTKYDYAFDIDSRAAHATVTFTADEGGDCITLPLRATIAPSLANVKLNGEKAGGSFDSGKLTACAKGIKTGATGKLEADVVIPLATLKDSQVGYSIGKDSQGNSFYYLVSWIDGCDQFGPCDNRPDQFATYHFTVTHPETYKVRCPGAIVEHGTSTECTFDLDGGPTYSTFGVAAYPAWTTTEMGSWGGVAVTVYDRPQTGITAKIDSAYHAGFVDWMQSQFGPYPFGNELRVLTAPTYWSGFEHPGNIVLDDKLIGPSSYANPVAHVLDHEMTHMWAGDQTTIATTYDFTWKEAMAEYLSYVWEDMHGTDGLVTAGGWKRGGMGAVYYPVPLDDPRPALIDFYGDAYGPGPMVLFRQLEVMTSRQQVLDALKMLLGHPHAMSVDDVLGALAQTTGLDLSNYANAWVHGKGAPDWPIYSLSYVNATHVLTLTLTNPKPAARGCKFHVALEGATAGQEQLVEVNTFTGGENQTITVPAPAFAVTKLVLDPSNECLVFSTTATITREQRYNPWVSRH